MVPLIREREEKRRPGAPSGVLLAVARARARVNYYPQRRIPAAGTCRYECTMVGL